MINCSNMRCPKFGKAAKDRGPVHPLSVDADTLKLPHAPRATVSGDSILRYLPTHTYARPLLTKA
jgi:hypothetical protein